MIYKRKLFTGAKNPSVWYDRQPTHQEFGRLILCHSETTKFFPIPDNVSEITMLISPKPIKGWVKVEFRHLSASSSLGMDAYINNSQNITNVYSTLLNLIREVVGKEEALAQTYRGTTVWLWGEL